MSIYVRPYWHKMLRAVGTYANRRQVKDWQVDHENPHTLEARGRIVVTIGGKRTLWPTPRAAWNFFNKCNELDREAAA